MGRVGCGAGKQDHLFRRSYVEIYQSWRQETADVVDKAGRVLPRPTTLNGEFSTIRLMFREVALAKGFITRDQLPDISNAKVPKDQSFRRSSFSAGNGSNWRRPHASIGRKDRPGSSRRDNPWGSTRSPKVPTRGRTATAPSPGTPSTESTTATARGCRSGHSFSKTTGRCSIWRCGSG